MSQQRCSNVFPYWFPPSFYRRQYWAFRAWNILGLLPVQQNTENHHSATSWEWMLLPSNTTHSHFKHISHVGLVFQTQARTLSVPHGLSHLLSAGFDESFQWISTSKSATGGSQGEAVFMMGEKWEAVMSLMGAWFMHTDRLQLSLVLPVWWENRGKAGRAHLCRFMFVWGGAYQIVLCRICALPYFSIENKQRDWVRNEWVLFNPSLCLQHISATKKVCNTKPNFLQFITLLHFQSS